MPPSAHTLSSDVTEVGNELIGNHPEQLGHLKNYSLVFLMRESQRTDNDFHVQSAGGAFIRSDRERGIRPDVDAGVWVQRRWWDNFSPHQRRAWVHGYLLRFGISPNGARLRLLRPDVVEWASIAREYGVWEPTLGLFVNELDDHANGNAAPGVPKRPVALHRPPASDASTAPIN
jgi:Putative phage metallopeptidase